MGSKKQGANKIAIVFGTLPNIDEIDQLEVLNHSYDIDIIASETVISYLSQNVEGKEINCVVLPEHDENPSFLPGLEDVLADYDIVIVKERIGIYAYQTVKAKWRYKFRLFTWVDNLKPFPSEDLKRLRTIRLELGQSTDGYIVQTQDAKRALMIEGIPASMIYMLAPYTRQKISPKKNGDRFKAKEKLGYKDSDWIILHDGPIEWEENLLELLTAIKILKDEDRSLAHRLHLALCGVGNFAAEIKKYAGLLGIEEQVEIHQSNFENLQTLIQAADCFYLSQLPSKDRIDGDPFRLIRPMTYKKPVLASRSSLVEEFIGKHRIDFCLGSPLSLAKACKKAMVSQSLTKDIAAKNFQKVQKQYQLSKFKANWEEMLNLAMAKALVEESAPINQKVLQAESRFVAKQYLEAVQIIEDVFKRKDLPRHHKSNLYRMIGDSFTKLGDPEAGKQAYIQALELDPYFAKAHIGLGTISLTKDKYDIAVIHFQKAVSFNPRDEMACLGLGLAFQGLGAHDEANKWVLKSLEIDPDNLAGLYALVKLASQIGNFADTERALAAYLLRHPEEINLSFALAGIQFEQKRYQDTIKLLEPLILKSPGDEKITALIERAKQELTKQRQRFVG